MVNELATTAYQLLLGQRRQWLGKSLQQIRDEARQQLQFWLVISAANDTLRPGVFRLPSRDYPFLITGAAVNQSVAELKLYSTDDELNSYQVPAYTVAGGSDGQRQYFRWSQPVLLLPHSAWRLEMVLVDNAALNQTTVIALQGVKLDRFNER